MYKRQVKRAGTEYFHNLLNDLVYNREKYLKQISEGIDKFKARFNGMNYRALDMFAHIREVLDDEHAIIVANPPTYFSGYEKYYDTGGMMTWREPQYELFDPACGHYDLFEMMKDAKALFLCYQEMCIRDRDYSASFGTQKPMRTASSDRLVGCLIFASSSTNTG